MTLKNLIIAFIVLMTSQFAISSNEMVNYVCSGTLQIRSDTPRDIENFKFTLVLNTKKKIYSIENLVELTVFQNITNMKVDEHSVEVYESNKGELRNVRFINLNRITGDLFMHFMKVKNNPFELTEVLMNNGICIK